MYFLEASYKSIFSLASLTAPSADHWGRQLFSLWLIVSLGGVFFYLFFAAMSYRFMYDDRLKAHPKVIAMLGAACYLLLAFSFLFHSLLQFLKDQIKRELSVALNSIPTMYLTHPLASQALHRCASFAAYAPCRSGPSSLCPFSLGRCAAGPVCTSSVLLATPHSP
jgi:hypothetical protein